MRQTSNFHWARRLSESIKLLCELHRVISGVSRRIQPGPKKEKSGSTAHEQSLG